MRNTSNLAVGLILFLGSCDDDFTQEDLIQLQDQQLDRAVEVLNNEGQFASALIKVITINDEPVQGARLTLETAGDSTGVRTISIVTDESGNANFSSVTAGGHNLRIEHEEYLNIEGAVDIGEIQYEVINGQVIPVKSSGSAIIVLFPSEGSSTGTISGQVTIQTDITTQAREFLGGIEVMAQIDPYFFQNSVTGNFVFETLNFESRTSIGSTVTDSLGYYTLTIPASEDGISYILDFPEVVRDQIIAISARDDIDLGVIQIDTVTSAFGRASSTDYSTIYPYSGISIQVPEPPTPGRGFSLNFQRTGRDWNPGDREVTATSIIPYPDPGQETTNQISEIGVGYVESPLVTITDSTGVGVVAEAFMEYAVQTLRLSGDSTGYAPSSPIIFTAEYDEASYVIADPSEIDTTLAIRPETLVVNSNNVGIITQDSVNAAIQRAIADSDPLFDPENLVEIDDWVVDLRFVNGAAQLLVTEAIGQLHEVNFISTGIDNDNYINPSVSFSGGGASVDAQFDIILFEAPYIVTPNNSQITSPYPGLPNEIAYLYNFVEVIFGVSDAEPIRSSLFEIYNNEGQMIDATSNFWRYFEVSNDSTIDLIVPNGGYLLSEWSVDEPIAVIEDYITETAYFGPLVDNNGLLQSLEIAVINQGQIIEINLPNNNISGTTPGGNESRISFGRGYTEPPIVSLISLSGNGAQIVEESNNDVLGYYRISNIIVINPGTGYERFINKLNIEPATSEKSIFIQAGDEAIFNFYYGTGERLENVR